MVLRAAKWAIQAALLLQVLQYSVSADGIDITFDLLGGEPEERSDDGDTLSTTPGPFQPRPKTDELVNEHKDYLTKMGVDISPYTGSGSDSPSPTPENKKPDDDISSLLSGLGGGKGSADDDKKGGDNGFASLLSGLGGGSGGGDDDFASLLSGLGGSGSGDAGLDSLFGGGGSGSGDMPSFKDFMSSMGPSAGGMGGLGALFGLVDPTVPQNKTVDDGDVIYGEVYGSDEHGDVFSDIDNIKYGQMVMNITIRGAARVDQFGILSVTQQTVVNLVHGGTGGGLAYVAPELGNTIESVEVHWQMHNGKTRIFYLAVITSDDQTLSAGTKTANRAIIKAPKGFQIAGFHGRANTDGIFGIGGIFTKIGAEDLEVIDVMPVSEKGSSDIYHYNTTIRNWLGPVETALDGGCYMKRHGVNSKNVCPSGYRKDGGTCITQCPLQYPTTCHLECVPQNADCTQEVIAKVAAVVSVALNVATMGVFTKIVQLTEATKFVVMCAIAVVNAIKSLFFYLRYKQVTIPHSDIEKLMDRAFQLQIVTLDLPLAVCACMGIQVPNRLLFPVIIVTVVAAVVMMVIMIGEMLWKSPDNVLMMMRESGVTNSTTMDRDVVQLDDFLNKQNTTCGTEIKTLTNRVMGKVKEIREATPDADEDDVRVEVSKSPIIMEDIPIITNHCMGEIWTNKTGAAAYKTRHLLRKTLNVIIEQLIKDGTTDMAKNVEKKDKALEYSNMGLFFLAMLDPTGIAWMASEFIQPICGPTEFLGEIDDGRLHEALGLRAVDQAFAGSYGIWKKEGNGTVKVHFESFDKYDVDVIIWSAGEKINEVHVPALGKVTWTATVKELEDKTLYMDRWRPGLFGLPGSGGGSLLLWVPRTSLGGHLILHARLNIS